MTMTAWHGRKTVRQLSLNNVVAATLAAVFCLLEATAYTQIKEADGHMGCVSRGRGIGTPAGSCAICPATILRGPAGAASDCVRGEQAANSAIDRPELGMTPDRWPMQVGASNPQDD
ncbi:hypothetical protein EN813_038860 [Mesorhizobium sp. M00.F.Ca.ET.170.01.1.1]|nr:hypothetical protein EN813_038860 [Mesorhizobium sp. M00.F.Ca.ET.170.01.1.1]